MADSSNSLPIGAFEGSAGSGLTLNAFLAWSKQLPAVLTSLKSLLAAGTTDTTSASTANPSLVSTVNLSGSLCPVHVATKLKRQLSLFLLLILAV